MKLLSISLLFLSLSFSLHSTAYKGLRVKGDVKKLGLWVESHIISKSNAGINKWTIRKIVSERFKRYGIEAVDILESPNTLFFDISIMPYNNASDIVNLEASLRKMRGNYNTDIYATGYSFEPEQGSYGFLAFVSKEEFNSYLTKIVDKFCIDYLESN